MVITEKSPITKQVIQMIHDEIWCTICSTRIARQTLKADKIVQIPFRCLVVQNYPCMRLSECIRGRIKSAISQPPLNAISPPAEWHELVQWTAPTDLNHVI